MNYIKKVSAFHKDERGLMSHLLDDETKITSALLITSKKGTTRASHYHKKDIHYIYLIKGKIEYTYKDLNSKTAKKKTVVVEQGYVVKTPAMVAHVVKFLENSEFLALTTEARNQKAYEKDTVRVELI